ncbi:MAG TPA: glycosidase [Deltaproteobacteria bacterium]|nr:glycosidase [Deltaproteobacteria bacterium]
MRAEELFERHGANPIIQPGDIPYRANSVFNAGAAKVGDDVLLLMRVEDRRGISHLTAARSRDGVSEWRIDPFPTLAPDPHAHPEEIWGIEDPRITRVDELDLWVILYTAYSKGGPLVSLATTGDFRTFERKGAVMAPEDKDAALFPVRFKGRWAMIHRPVPAMAGMGAHIWISFSPDMRHWGDHQILIPARKGAWWDANKVGLSPPPLRTSRGWLILYHGVRATAGGCLYRLGLALLDLEDPTRVLARSDEWVFAPEEDYELTGDVDKVVFPCGWVAEGDDVLLYYGGADRCIALARASLSRMLDWLEERGRRRTGGGGGR